MLKSLSMADTIKREITPRYGQDIDQLVAQWKEVLTNKVAPIGEEPKVAENCRRIALTKGDSRVEISIGS